ncbi:MAG: hypothetical protein ACE5JX_15935 [Acidobacteriota bacterium]
MPRQSDKFSTLTCLGGKRSRDPLLDESERDVEASSLLGAMKSYIDELRGELDNNARPFLKIARLFDNGLTPTHVEGHHDGVAIGLRTGDQEGLLASYGNFMGLLWSTAVGPVAPWVGKSLNTVDAIQLRQYTDGFLSGDAPTYLGINHFNKLEDSIVNKFSFSVLTAWMHLKDAPTEERQLYGHDKNGGLFIARRTQSVYDGTDREVFQLNYRWANLGNMPPFTHLIDELVEIADGVYLGQLLFATDRLLGRYDPNLSSQEYHYQHFGYFLLMDDSWARETRRVFPHIESGRIIAAPGTPTEPTRRSVAVPPSPRAQAAKFTTFTFADPTDGNCNDSVLADIRKDMQRYTTILDLLKFYSDQLSESFDNRSPYFIRLHELFNRGIGPDEVRGFYRGALISFHSDGYYRFFNVNTLNVAWIFGQLFSPWTGKSFEEIGLDRLKRFTDNFETGSVPTFWGANTLSFKTAKEKFTKQMMKLAGLWAEDVPAEESRKFGYDTKSFFFIAHKAKSVNKANKAKKIFQFNYRWRKLRTFPPDNYCIDELVMIAEGLYLGQLIYATELLKKYDPRKPSSAYKYRLFGYFLLMDEEWHKRRLDIGFDPANV